MSLDDITNESVCKNLDFNLTKCKSNFFKNLNGIKKYETKKNLENKLSKE